MDSGKSQTEINREVHEALYGVNGQPGVVDQVRDMAQILSAFKLFGRGVMWIALAVGAIGTAVSTLIALFKHFFETGK